MDFKICIIGCGSHATSVHGPSYLKYAAEHPGTVLAACCDKDAQKAEIFRQSFGFMRYYTDYMEMLDIEKPDAVCLASPVQHTAAIASDILGKGIPLILEKPPGKDVAEVKGLIEIAERKTVPNRVAFNRRYMPMIRRLKSIIDENMQPSDIQSIYYSISRIDRRDADFSTTAIHGIDAVRYIAGSDYAQVRFHYQEFPKLGPGVKNIYMDCTMKSGAVARLDFCPVAGVVTERAVINAYDRTLFLNTPMWNEYDTPGRLISLYKGKTEYDACGDAISDGKEIFENGGFYFEDASFFDDIRHGRTPQGDLKSSLQSVEVAECICRNLNEYNAQENGGI